MALAIYEILQSVEKNKIAKRSEYYKNKYSFPIGDDNSDKLENMKCEFPIVDTWQLALNELSLFGVYLGIKQ